MKISVLFLLCLFICSCASVMSEDKEAAVLHLRIGTTQLTNGNYPEALSELLVAEELDPSNPAVQNNLGITYFVRERMDLAETHIRKALSLDSKFSDARNNLARLLIERGKYSEAMHELDIVINDLTYINPEKPLVNMGICYFKQGKFEKAKEYFAKAIDFKRDDCSAQSYFGRSLFEMKDYPRAKEALDRAVGFCMRTQFDEPHYYSALAYYQLGQKDKAIVRFEEIIKLYPQGKYVDKAKAMLDTIKR